MIHLSISQDGTVEISDGMNKPKREHKGESQIELLDEYIVIDLETTGFNPNYDEIIEVGAIKISDGNVIDSFSSLVKPENKIDDFIAELTGITNKMVEDAPSIEQVLPNFIEFIGDSMLVGHNVSFDINFLYDSYELWYDKYISNSFIDVLRLSRKLFQNFENHKLITLTKKFNIPTSNFHRALADCEYTYKCYEYIKHYISENNVDIDQSFKRKYKYIKDNNQPSKHITISPEYIGLNENSEFFGKVCVFTGVLDKMQRKDAMQIVTNLGGICKDTLTQNTNYLILGDNSYCSTIKDGKSSKHKKAEDYILRGCDLKIIPESVFYDIIFEEQKEIEVTLSEKEKAEKIIEQAKEYFSNKDTLLAIRERIKYSGTDPINLKFSSEYLTPAKRSGYFSLSILGNVLGYINISKNNLSFKFSPIWFPKIEKRTIILENFEDIKFLLLTSAIEILLSLESGEKDIFDCCSRYMECSDCKACVQPLFEVAVCCTYWRKIRKGIIGFGENRNV